MFLLFLIFFYKLPFFQDEVMEAAAKYIETLQNNLVGQIRTHGYPDKLKSFSNRSDDFDSIRRAVDNYACAKMKWTHPYFQSYILTRNHPYFMLIWLIKPNIFKTTCSIKPINRIIHIFPQSKLCMSFCFLFFKSSAYTETKTSPLSTDVLSLNDGKPVRRKFCFLLFNISTNHNRTLQSPMQNCAFFKLVWPPWLFLYESTSVCEEEFLGSYLQIDHYSKKTKIAHLGRLSRSYASFSFHSVAFQCREYVIGITVAKSWPLVAPLFLEAPPRSSIVWGFLNLKKCRG